jgi:hypothetical protein
VCRCVGHRGGEVALLVAPLPQRGVLVTNDADHLAGAEDRRVEHRDDTERFQIRGAQLVGEFVAARRTGRDVAVIFEGAAVVREIGDAQHRAR